MRKPCFETLAPDLWQVPAIFNSPHSGRYMPPEFLKTTVLSPRELRQSEDCYVDELFSGCLDNGAPLLRALISRAYLDLNREPFEFDSHMFAESLPGYMNSASPRVAAGFGTVPRYVGDGRAIYRCKLPLAEALSRVENAYRPYHRTLNALLDQAHDKTGIVLLLDCHSMPCQSAAGKSLADVVLGDRFGSSCGSELISEIESYFTAKGMNVVRNWPYAGGFITAVHGTPQRNRHAVQIEINRALYMNEQTLEKTAGFAELRKLLSDFTRQLGWIMTAYLTPAR